MVILPIALTIILSPIAFLSGCHYLQKPTIPIESVSYPADNNTQSKTLVLLLPGLGDKAKIFARKGIVDKLHRLPSRPDIVAINAHFSYYEDRTIKVRIMDDILQPALTNGYTDIHIVGVSLGGFGALMMLKAWPELITSIALIAPYLGEPEYYDYLIADTETAPKLQDQKNLWPWLTQLDTDTAKRIYIGFGSNDKFVLPNQLLSRQLPIDNHMVIDGKHRWATFTQVIEKLIMETDFAK
jgi:pimeloyl-ACP methyl ester carboxylesterase